MNKGFRTMVAACALVALALLGPVLAAEPTSATLGLTVPAYSQRFDAMSKQLGTPYRMRPAIDTDQGVATGFRATLSDNIGVDGYMDAGKVTQVTLTIGSQATPDELANALNTELAALAAAVQGTTIKQATPTLLRVLHEGRARVTAGETGFTVTHTLNGVDVSMYVGADRSESYTATTAD